MITVTVTVTVAVTISVGRAAIVSSPALLDHPPRGLS